MKKIYPNNPFEIKGRSWEESTGVLKEGRYKGPYKKSKNMMTD